MGERRAKCKALPAIPVMLAKVYRALGPAPHCEKCRVKAGGPKCSFGSLQARGGN